MSRIRWIVAGVVLVLVAAGGTAFALTRDDGPAIVAATAGARSCANFPASGSKIDDQDLLDRALAGWQAHIADENDGEDDPDDLVDAVSGRVCAVNAEVLADGDDQVPWVTMTDGERFAVWEGDHGDEGTIRAAGDVEIGETAVLPIGDDRYLARRDYSQLAVHVATATGKVVVTSEDSVMDVGAALRDQAAGSTRVSWVLVLGAQDAVLAVPLAAGTSDLAVVELAGAEGADPAVDAAETLLSRPLAVPLVAAAVRATHGGAAASTRPSRLTPLGSVDVGSGRRALVAVDRTFTGASTSFQRTVVLAAAGPDGTSSGRVMGTVAKDYRSWAGGAYLPAPGADSDAPVPAADRVYVAAAEVAGSAPDPSAITLEVRAGAGRVTGKSPVLVVTPTTLPDLGAGEDAPPTLVIGTDAAGQVVGGL